MIAPAANAAGLGKLVVLSAMGEAFRAEISVLPDTAPFPDTRILTPRLASPDSYPQSGFRYNPALTGTRLEVRTGPDGRQVIDVISARPLNEPFVYLLVEIESNGARMLRAYTALLDPPGYRAPQVAAVEYMPAAVAAPALKPAAVPAPMSDQHRVVARPASRQERLSDADAKALAAMLERVAALEAAVAQLQRQWDKPDVAAVKAAEEAPPVRNPLAVKVSPAPPAPVVQQVPAAFIEPMQRRTPNQDSLLNHALLVLAIGLLILLGGLVYVLRGRPAVQERLARGKGRS